jgi:mannose-6-phosphate isomerase-like protein (cupin superfamily)
MAVWATQDVRLLYDYVSPSQATEIRLLPNLPRGEIVHATTPPRRVSGAAVLDGITEFFFVLAGHAELWRAVGDTEEITRLFPGRWSFDELGHGLPVGAPHRPSWTADLRDDPDYIAPDGSEIRLLLEDEAGGFAHCSMTQGACSQAVRHRTVDEIWFVLGGTGTIWRRSESSDTAEDLLRPARCVTIPVGTSFQFRADPHSPLRIGIGTFPRWPGAEEAEPVDGPWELAGPGNA